MHRMITMYPATDGQTDRETDRRTSRQCVGVVGVRTPEKFGLGVTDIHNFSLPYDL